MIVFYSHVHKASIIESECDSPACCFVDVDGVKPLPVAFQRVKSRVRRVDSSYEILEPVSGVHSEQQEQCSILKIGVKGSLSSYFSPPNPDCQLPRLARCEIFNQSHLPMPFSHYTG